MELIGTVKAVWNDEQRRYVADPSTNDFDLAGERDSGWWSEDGDCWLDFGGGDCRGDFERVNITLVGGPRDGETVA